MVNINLLPWREAAQKNRQKKIRILVVFLSLIMSAGLYYFFKKNMQHRNVVEKKLSHQQPRMGYFSLRDMRYVGFLQSGNEWTGVVFLPNGKCVYLKIGSLVGIEKAAVSSINSEKIVLKKNNKIYYLKSRS